MSRMQVVRRSIVALAVCAAVVATIAGRRVPQPLSCHDMADQRAWLGIPNALNVLSNLPLHRIYRHLHLRVRGTMSRPLTEVLILPFSFAELRRTRSLRT